MANTAFNMGVVGLFLPLWINRQEGTTDADLGLPIAMSMLVILIISPFLGALTDQLKSSIRALTLLNIIAVVATFFIGVSEKLVVGIVLFSIAFVAVYLAEVIYNTLLVGASTPRNIGKVGGIAIGLGFIGSLAVIGLALKYQGVDPNYKLEFQVIAALFFLMSVPITFFYVEKKDPGNLSTQPVLQATWEQIKRTREYFQRYPQIAKFFMARYFYMVAVTTSSTFGVLYGIKTIGFTERQVEYLLLVGIIVSIPSAVFWGYVVDSLGPRITLRWNLSGWVFIFVGTVSIPWLNLDNQLWWPLGALTGFCFGGLWVADRPLLIDLSPLNLGEMFGIYGTISRLAFLTGSFLWSLIVVTFDLGQPFAVFFLLCSSIIGLVLLFKLQQAPASTSSDHRF